MNKVIELFGYSVEEQGLNWAEIVKDQKCPYLGKRCYKTRKSNPNIAIGTCSVLYGKGNNPVGICPTRLTENRQIFIDCLHLLTNHEPGNELHIVSEVSVPGGSVDFFLVSVKDSKVHDFVGVELQTLDTTGTVWPERQRKLRELGLNVLSEEADSGKPFGMNWKMTAKTILVQMHHKVQTFEHVNKKLVLVLQDSLLEYMKAEFKFDHLRQKASNGDSMHFHAYQYIKEENKAFKIRLKDRLSTDADGIGLCLGLQAEAKIELEMIVRRLQAKISNQTLFKL
jgi:Restriction endonuclease NotI